MSLAKDLVRLAFVLWMITITMAQLGGRDVVCREFEVRCEQRFCFDRTCQNLSIPGLQNGRCRCENGRRRDARRRCVPANQCPGSPDRPAPPPPPRPRPPPVGDLTNYRVLYSLYHKGRQDHLYTTELKEIDSAIDSGYDFEEPIARVATTRDSGEALKGCNLRPLVRYWEPTWAVDHFYTIDPSQGEAARRQGYSEEGVVGYCVEGAPGCGATFPLWRFYKNSAGDHGYATREETREEFVANEYDPEGIECYMWPNKPEDFAFTPSTADV